MASGILFDAPLLAGPRVVCAVGVVEAVFPGWRVDLEAISNLDVVEYRREGEK